MTPKSKRIAKLNYAAVMLLLFSVLLRLSIPAGCDSDYFSKNSADVTFPAEDREWFGEERDAAGETSFGSSVWVGGSSVWFRFFAGGGQKPTRAMWVVPGRIPIYLAQLRLRI